MNFSIRIGSPAALLNGSNQLLCQIIDFNDDQIKSTVWSGSIHRNRGPPDTESMIWSLVKSMIWAPYTCQRLILTERERAHIGDFKQ